MQLYIKPTLNALLGMLLGVREEILYSGKLSREKTFTNFTVLWLFEKVFFAKFVDVASFGAAKASNLQKSYFSPIRGSFLPQSFPLYSKCMRLMCKYSTIQHMCTMKYLTQHVL